MHTYKTSLRFLKQFKRKMYKKFSDGENVLQFFEFCKMFTDFHHWILKLTDMSTGYFLLMHF